MPIVPPIVHTQSVEAFPITFFGDKRMVGWSDALRTKYTSLTDLTLKESGDNTTGPIGVSLEIKDKFLIRSDAPFYFHGTRSPNRTYNIFYVGAIDETLIQPTVNDYSVDFTVIDLVNAKSGTASWTRIASDVNDGFGHPYFEVGKLIRGPNELRVLTFTNTCAIVLGTYDPITHIITDQVGAGFFNATTPSDPAFTTANLAGTNPINIFTVNGVLDYYTKFTIDQDWTLRNTKQAILKKFYMCWNPNPE